MIKYKELEKCPYNFLNQIVQLNLQIFNKMSTILKTKLTLINLIKEIKNCKRKMFRINRKEIIVKMIPLCQ